MKRFTHIRMDYCKTGREEKLILEGWGNSQERFVGRGDKAEPRFFCFWWARGKSFWEDWVRVELRRE